jgi:hypothetical protein
MSIGRVNTTFDFVFSEVVVVVLFEPAVGVCSCMYGRLEHNAWGEFVDIVFLEYGSAKLGTIPIFTDSVGDKLALVCDSPAR